MASQELPSVYHPGFLSLHLSLPCVEPAQVCYSLNSYNGYDIWGLPSKPSSAWFGEGTCTISLSIGDILTDFCTIACGLLFSDFCKCQWAKLSMLHETEMPMASGGSLGWSSARTWWMNSPKYVGRAGLYMYSSSVPICKTESNTLCLAHKTIRRIN